MTIGAIGAIERKQRWGTAIGAVMVVWAALMPLAPASAADQIPWPAGVYFDRMSSDEDVRAVLGALCEQSGLRALFDDSVRSRVSFDFNTVPPVGVFNMVVEENGLQWLYDSETRTVLFSAHDGPEPTLDVLRRRAAEAAPVAKPAAAPAVQAPARAAPGGRAPGEGVSPTASRGEVARAVEAAVAEHRDEVARLAAEVEAAGDLEATLREKLLFETDRAQRAIHEREARETELQARITALEAERTAGREARDASMARALEQRQADVARLEEALRTTTVRVADLERNLALAGTEAERAQREAARREDDLRHRLREQEQARQASAAEAAARAGPMAGGAEEVRDRRIADLESRLADETRRADDAARSVAELQVLLQTRMREKQDAVDWAERKVTDAEADFRIKLRNEQALTEAARKELDQVRTQLQRSLGGADDRAREAFAEVDRLKAELARQRQEADDRLAAAKADWAKREGELIAAVPGGAAAAFDQRIDITTGYQLSGIGVVDGSRHATIGHQSYGVGDELDGMTITAVEPDRVLLTAKTADGPREYIIGFSPQQPVAAKEIDLTWVHRLTGIGRSRGQPFANLNGHKVHAGDEVAGMKVTAIGADTVYLISQTPQGLIHAKIGFRKAKE